MDAINAEESDYKTYPIPKFYPFSSPEERERILYKNFIKVREDVKEMITEVYATKRNGI